MAHLVHIHQSCMREVEWGNEQTHTLTLHSITIQVVCHQPGHKVFACA